MKTTGSETVDPEEVTAEGFCFVFVPRDFFGGRIIGRFSFYSSFNLCLVFPFLFIVTEGSAASTIKRRLVKADFDTLLNFNQV